MTITVSLVLDLLLALFLSGIIYKAYRRGFLASLIQLAGTAASFVLASVMSRPAATALYDRFLGDWVQRYVEERLLPQHSGLSQALEGLSQAGEAAGELLSGVLGELKLDFFANGDAGQMGQGILDRLTQGMEPAQAVAEVAVRPMVLTVLNIGVFFLLFTVAMLAVRLLTGLGLGVNHVPLVGGLNRMAGLLCGAAYAALVGYLVVVALVFLAAASKNRWELLNTDVLEQTHLIRWFMNIKTLLP